MSDATERRLAREAWAERSPEAWARWARHVERTTDPGPAHYCEAGWSVCVNWGPPNLWVAPQDLRLAYTDGRAAAVSAAGG